MGDASALETPLLDRSDIDNAPADFLGGRGPLADLIRSHDWASTPLGPIETWPQSLKTATGLLVASPVPIVMLWGPEGVMIYNDAYSGFAGGRHPKLLGCNVREGWPEVADFNDNVMNVGLAGGTLAYQDQELTLYRHGPPEQVFMNLDYSPVPDETGRPAGVLAIVVETTGRVLAERRAEQERRRQTALIALDDSLADTRDPLEITAHACRIVGETLGASRVGYGVVDPEAVTIQVTHDWLAHEGLPSVVGSHAYGDYGAYADDLLGRRPVTIADVRADPRTNADPLPLLSLGVAALMDVPLSDAGRTVSQMLVHSETPREWTAEEIAFVRDIGERTRASLARREAERDAQIRGEELQRLSDSLPLLVSFVDRDHRYALMNRAYVDWFGPQALAFVGRPLREVLGEAAYAKALPRMEAALAGETVSFEDYLPYTTSPGRHIRADYVPRRDESGAVDGFYAVVQDITERKSAEMRQGVLVALTDAIRDLTDPADIGFAASRVLGEFLGVDRVGYGTVNPDAETMTVERDWTGPAAESVKGVLRLREWGSFIDPLKRGETVRVDDVRGHPATAGAVRDLEQAACRAFLNLPLLEGGELVAVVFVNAAEPRVWTDAEVLLTQEFASQMRSAAERARAVQIVASNARQLRFLDDLTHATTGLTDADAVLSVTTRMTAAHLGVANCAYADMDEDQDGFTIRDDWAEPGMASIVGRYRLADFGKLAVQELSAGRPLIINDNLTEIAPEEAATFQAIGIGATICMPLVKDGRLTALMAVHHRGPHRWTDQELALLREVTERSWAHVERVGAEAELRESEAALRALNATLEDRVAERTAELMHAEEALRQSQKMEAVGQLTGGIAHDFNNLLAGISGSLELIEKRMAEGRLTGMERYIQAAQGASRRAATLTQRLLAFSRRQTLDPRPTDVNRLIADMEDLIRRSVGPDVRVEIETASDLWSTRIDPSQLENALLNLCINGRDAMAPAGGRLTIRTWNVTLGPAEARARDLPPGDYVKLSVADTGSGMTPEVVAKAFDPFFTTKPLGQGTGLGLSMIHGFMRQSGGQVRIETELGQGSTITLALPRWTGSIASGEEPVAEAVVEDPGQGETVLVIDDEETVRMLVVEVLEDAGYVALQAADGPAGLAILNSDARVDLLISDVGLPGGMNGRQVADAARIARPGLKVLFITGYAENAVVAGDTLEPGMAVMTKPFQVVGLANRVREMLEV